MAVLCFDPMENQPYTDFNSVVISNPYSEAQHPAQDGNGRGDYGDPDDKDDHSLITDSESELDLNEDIASIASSLDDRLT